MFLKFVTKDIEFYFMYHKLVAFESATVNMGTLHIQRTRLYMLEPNRFTVKIFNGAEHPRRPKASHSLYCRHLREFAT